MQINTPAEVVQAIEYARIEQGVSARSLSARAGKSPSSYYWWLRKARTCQFEFETAFEYARALGLTFSIDNGVANV